MIYKTFKEWKNGQWLEDGEPRKKAYTKDELLLVEMGWKYGFDAGKLQQAKRIEELEKEKDGCGNCHACLVEVMENGFPKIAQRMILCPDCGNKRCPKASNHRYKCTGSNEVGQLGSVYTHPHKELSDEEIMKHFSEYWNHIGQIQIDEDFLLIAIRAIIKASRGEE